MILERKGVGVFRMPRQSAVSEMHQQSGVFIGKMNNLGTGKDKGGRRGASHVWLIA